MNEYEPSTLKLFALGSWVWLTVLFRLLLMLLPVAVVAWLGYELVMFLIEDLG